MAYVKKIGAVVGFCYIVLLLFLSFAPQAEAVACRRNSDCGENGFTGLKFCKGESDMYQEYVTWTCNNAGSARASCSQSKSQVLVQTCSASDICFKKYLSKDAWCERRPVVTIGSGTNTQNQGSASTANITNTTSPTSNTGTACGGILYKKCSGNAIYWYDACGKVNKFEQYCAYNQTCQSGACVNFGASLASNSYNGSNGDYPSATGQPIQPQVQGATTVSTGQTNNFLTDSFFLPLMAALIGVWVYRANLLKKIRFSV